MQDTWKFSRSHIACRRECERMQFLTYYADGTGYESAGVNVEQSTGTLLHSAGETLLQGSRQPWPGSLVHHMLRREHLAGLH